MSTILAALRRAEQERQRQPTGEPLLPTLPGGPLLSSESSASAALARRQLRYQRLGFRLLLLLLGASGMWLGLRQESGSATSATALSTLPVANVARVAQVMEGGAVQSGSALPGVDVHLGPPQVLNFPRLETEHISADQLASAALAERDSWALPPPIAGIALDDNLISAADILPTPPLPTDPVRRPRAASLDAPAVPEPDVASARVGGDTVLTSPTKLDLRGVSPELAQAFRAALQDKSAANTALTAVSTVPATPTAPVKKGSTSKALPQLRHLPAARRALIPALRFEVHNYVSAPDKRWVRINGQVYHSGAQLANGVQLVRIEPEQIVLAVKGQQAALPALQDWPGGRG